ncbi:hypothetical protein BBJ28_00026082 [Nothophytophthora sp. Chile5]|nr:hypothetical protein BBJ28_00026082 [Nothophytophthora sp. Chile5]
MGYLVNDSDSDNASPDLMADSRPSAQRATRGQDRVDTTTASSGSSRHDRSASRRIDYDREETEREDAERAADTAVQGAIVRGQQVRRGRIGATGKALGTLCIYPGCTARVMFTQSFAVHFRSAHGGGFSLTDRNQYERAVDDTRILSDPRVLQHRLANQEIAMARIAERMDSVVTSMSSCIARMDSVSSDMNSVKAGVDSMRAMQDDMESVKAGVASLTRVVAPTSIGATIDKKLEGVCKAIIENQDLNGLGRSICDETDENFRELAQKMFARFERLERGLRATKRSSSSDAPSRRSPAKVARRPPSQTVYDVTADDDEEESQGDEASAAPTPTSSPTPSAATTLPLPTTPAQAPFSATTTLPLPTTPAQAPPSPTPSLTVATPAQALPAPPSPTPSLTVATSGPASLPPKSTSTPKAKAKSVTPSKKQQKRKRINQETNIKKKAEEAPKIEEQYRVVCMSWEDRTKSLATAEAKLAANPNDTAAKKSVAEFKEVLKSIGKDKDALGAQLTLYELLEATAGAPKFLTDVNRRATSEKAKRATFNNKVKLAAGFLTARKNDFANAVDEEAKKAAHKELEMATAAHKKASDDAAKQINVATAVLTQKSQTKVSVDRMIKFASTVLDRLDAESIDADFVGVCADAKRDFVAFRKQVESFDVESVTL